MGYYAIYPAEAIEAHRAFITRRRAQRPGEEYRTPTDAEWDDFLGHFERRKSISWTVACSPVSPRASYALATDSSSAAIRSTCPPGASSPATGAGWRCSAFASMTSTRVSR
ncbi:hypothetical protein [Streptomyces sp. NPDC048350]|uniref:hypothetical protein n=1 Tax=Streptomyces sp. NPDC048350 TaxID=3365538 RepID=UPI003712F06B